MALHGFAWQQWVWYQDVNDEEFGVNLSPSDDRKSYSSLDIRIKQPLVDVVEKSGEKLIVNVAGGKELGNWTVVLTVIFTETNTEKTGKLYFPGPLTIEEYDNIVAIGNAIIKSAEESPDVYVVFKQAIRKYEMASYSTDRDEGW